MKTAASFSINVRYMKPLDDLAYARRTTRSQIVNELIGKLLADNGSITNIVT